MARTRIHTSAGKPAEAPTEDEIETVPVIDPDALAADDDAPPATPPSPSTRAREAAAPAPAPGAPPAPERAPEPPAAPTPAPAGAEAPGTKPGPGTATYRVWSHGTLQRNGRTYGPGETLVLPVEVGDAIACLARV